MPGLRRRRRGRGFSYLDLEGRPVRDESTLERIRALAIPPAWGPDELLAYRAGRRWVAVRSEDVNGYLKDRAGAPVSAKDFRTWNGTVLAAVALARRGDRPSSKTARRRAIAAAVREVAVFLGNTPAVARSSYIDPRVIDCFLSGDTIAPAHERGRRAIEAAVLDLIDR
jgi:DNA topoisomerase I